MIALSGRGVPPNNRMGEMRVGSVDPSNQRVRSGLSEVKFLAKGLVGYWWCRWMTKYSDLDSSLMPDHSS
jgi:hypothetical protein